MSEFTRCLLTGALAALCVIAVGLLPGEVSVDVWLVVSAVGFSCVCVPLLAGVGLVIRVAIEAFRDRGTRAP